MRKLRKLLRLNPGERWMLAQAVILPPLTALLLRLTGLRWCQRLFSNFIPHNYSQKTEQSETTLTRARCISHLVGLAVR